MSKPADELLRPVSCGQSLVLIIAGVLTAAAVTTGGNGRQAKSTFASDLEFLQQHITVVVLGRAPGPQLAVAPAYQGRVMTSTVGGRDAPGFGWIGRAAISSGTRQPHMNVFGGEDRFWLGPEGGQYALYFPPGSKFELSQWQVPEGFDWGSWDVVDLSGTLVSFRKHLTLTNYSGTRLEADVDRAVRLLNGDDAARQLGVVPGKDVRMVAFESSNTIANAGRAPWQRSSGLLSVWILGQFNPSRATTIVIPFEPGPESTRGPIVNDAYFGKVPRHRLVVGKTAIFFKGDGQYRSKIGLSPSRARSAAGSYDPSMHALTVVQYTRPADAREYVNSMWEIQREPYKGDVINSYNDGPPAPGQPPLGPFYELETSSPALALAPGERYTHVHRTFHLVGPEAELDRIAQAVLNVSLAEVTKALR